MTTAHPHPRVDFEPFRVDPDAFDDWIALRSDTIENELTGHENPGPAAALGSLVEEAVVFGPIVGDDRVELDLITADDPPRSRLCAHRPAARPTDIARADLRMDQPHLPAKRR